jgi:hypothetical protein
MVILPSQKSERTEEFWKGSIDYYIDQYSVNDEEFLEMIKLYNLVSGKLEQQTLNNTTEGPYSHVVNPYNYEGTDKNDKLRKRPARIRNYDIISPLIKVYLGELSRKPMNHQVIVKNADVENVYKEALNEAIEKSLTRQVINALGKNGVDTGMSFPEEDTQEVAAQFKDSYDDRRAIVGQEALDYLKLDLDLKDKYQIGAYDYFSVGRVFTFKEVYRNDINFKVVSPLHIKCIGLPLTGIVEDSEAAVMFNPLTVSEFIDRYRENLPENLLEILEGKRQTVNDEVQNMMSDTIISNGSKLNTQNKINTFVVQWKSLRKIKILTYIDEFGVESELEVDTSYKLNPENGDIKLTTEWINQTLQGVRADIGNEKYYVEKKPLEVDRSEINNISKSKLGFNGRVLIDRLGNIISEAKLLEPYQELVNILHYRAEALLAKSKDKITFIPYDILPDGWTMDKFLHYMDSMSIGFVDGGNEKTIQFLQYIKSIDLSLGNYYEGLYRIINEVKQEAWTLIGMNAPRYGDISGGDGKGVTEQAIFRSSIISTELFRKYFKFIEKDLQGLLDYSKVAWIEGKKGTFINSDGRVTFLNINGTDHLESDYGVFVTDSVDEENKAANLKNLLQPYIQNGGKMAAAAEIINTDNYHKIKSIAKKFDKLQQEFEQQQADAQNKSLERVAEMESADKEKMIDLEKYKADSSYKATVDAALIRINGGDDEKNESEEDSKIQEKIDKRYEEVVKAGIKREEILAKNTNNIRDNKTKVEVAQIAAQAKKMQQKETGTKSKK